MLGRRGLSLVRLAGALVLSAQRTDVSNPAREAGPERAGDAARRAASPVLRRHPLQALFLSLRCHRTDRFACSSPPQRYQSLCQHPPWKSLISPVIRALFACGCQRPSGVCSGLLQKGLPQVANDCAVELGPAASPGGFRTSGRHALSPSPHCPLCVQKGALRPIVKTLTGGVQSWLGGRIGFFDGLKYSQKAQFLTSN